MENKSTNDFIDTDLGNVSLNPCGDYSESANYEYLDTVFYWGGSYVAIKDVIGIAPKKNKNSEYWQCITIAGDTTPEFETLVEQVSKDANVASTSSGIATSAANIATEKSESANGSAEIAATKATEALKSSESAVGYAKDVKANADIVVSVKNLVVEKIEGFEDAVSETTNSAKDAVEAQKVVSVREAKEEIGPLATAKVKEQVDAQKGAITELGSSSLSAIATSKSDSLSAIDTAKANSLNAVETAKANAVEAVATEGNTQVANVTEAGEAYQNQINEVKDNSDKNTVDIQKLTEDLDTKVTQPYVNNKGALNIVDSDSCEVKNLKITGATYQNTTTGKNLCPPLKKGVVISSVNGQENAANNNATTDFIEVTSGATYFLSGLCGTINSFVGAYDENKQWVGRTDGKPRGEIKLTIIESTFNGSYTGNTNPIKFIRITQYTITGNAGVLDDIDNYQAQLELGDVATSYEPYTGGKPSPNPDYPQEIKGVEGAIKVVGKNLFGGKELYSSILKNGGTATNDQNIVNYLANAIDGKVIVSNIFKENTAYTFILNMKAVTKTQSNLRIIYTDGSYMYCGTPTADIYRDYVFVTDKSKTVKELKGAWYDGSTSLDCSKSGIFEGAVTVKEYQPYTSCTSRLLCKDGAPIVLNKLDGYKDYIEVKNNRVLYHKNIDVYTPSVIYASMQEYDPSKNTVRFSIKNDNWLYTNDTINFVKSNALKTAIVWDDDYEGCYSSSDLIIVRLNKNRLNTVDANGVTKFLNENPITFHRVMAKEIVTDITDQINFDFKTYYPATNIFFDGEVEPTIEFDYKVNLASWYNLMQSQDEKTKDLIYNYENDNGPYSENYWEHYFALKRTGKVYRTKVWKFATNPTSAGEKLLDNAGLRCEPSTNLIEGIDDYADIPLFKWVHCNYVRDADGTPRPIAIEGDKNYKTDGGVDVGAMQMSFYYNVDTSNPEYDLYTVSDMPNSEYGLKPWPECVKSDGTTVPWCIGSCYVSGTASDGLLRSQPNLISAYNQSHNGMISAYQKKGTGYWGAGVERQMFHILFNAIKYATKNSQKIYKGCVDYSYQYAASIERTELDTYFPLTKAQANNLVVGSNVSVGYGYNSSGSLSNDRSYATVHAYGRSVKVLRIEDLDDANSAVYLDIAPFATTKYKYSDTLSAPIIISVMPWTSGSTDKVIDHHDGSYLSNTNSKMPYRCQGREYQNGQWIVAGNAVMEFQSDYSKKVLVAPRGVAHTTSEATIKTTYKNVGIIPVNGNGIDFWIGDIGVDVTTGTWYPKAKGGSDAQGTGDHCYAGGAYTSGFREYLMCGNLGRGSTAGACLLYCWNGLSSAGWHIAACD